MRLQQRVMTLIAALFLTLVFAQAAAAQLVLDPPNGALPDVQAGVSFSVPLTVSGGNPPSGEYVVDPRYSFIPAGLTVERTGPDSFALAGTLTAAGDYDIYIAIAEGLSDDDDFIDGVYTLKVLPPPPSIAAVSPNSGSVNGGTQVTITGTGFTANATVDIGGNPAATVTFVSSTQIRAVTPPGAAGAADVLVTTDGGSVTEPSAFTYGVAPTIAALSPASGPAAGGTSVTITGTGFTAGTSVSIDGTQVAPTSFSSVQIRFTTPPGSPGDVAVVVTSGGIAATATFTYLELPVLSPASGNLPDGQVGKPYRAEFTVSGGDGPFISLGFNGAPQGLYLDDITDTGFVLTGTPTTDGTFTVNVNARNNAGTAQGTFTMRILPPAPVITSVTPNKGPVYGGTVVTIEGDGFLTARRVFIGGSIATSQQVVSRWVIRAEIPPAQLNRTGTVDVWVDNFNGEESPITADTKFTYEAPPPVVDSVTPNSGPVAGGTVVTIRGSEFRGLNSWSVLFGDQRATNLRVISHTELQATSPAGSAGPVDVTVNAEGGLSVPGADSIFTYVAPLAVTSVSPASGLIDGGTAVTITGTGFTEASAVSFGGIPALAFFVDDDTEIMAVAPARDGPSLVDVTVERPGESAQLANAFEYYVPLVLSPSAGDLPEAVAEEPYSVSFTASGGDGTYTFDTSDVPTELTASVQGGVLTLSGSFDGPQLSAFTIGVVSGTQTTTGEYSLLVQPPMDAPVIIQVSPSVGTTAGGMEVTIIGENFVAPMTVTFGGVPAANVRVLDNSTITATAPAGPIGPVDVTVTRADKQGTEPDGFTYVAPPAINAIAPAFGPIFGGTEVTITGTGLADAVAVNFGVTDASFTVVSDTQITARVPAVGSAGVVDVEVVTILTASVASAASRFTYVGPPVIDAITPDLGSTHGGTVVTITGSGFTGTSAVSFGATPAASYSIDSDTQITATTPAGAAGTIDVVVTALAGTSAPSAASRFTYVAPPTISAITPASGSTLGGTAVTITGTGFMGASAVSFGGTTASFSVDSDTQITAMTPTGTGGTVYIEVTTPGGTSAADATSRFTYVAPPAIDAIAPALGPTDGGTEVTITGSGFTGASAVNFGGTAATFTVNSDTQITATAPAGAAGIIDVTVATPYGTSVVNAAAKFTYVGLVNIYAVSPSGGPVAGGTEVTITGTGFTGASAVSFGGIAAASYTIDSDTQITAMAPAGAAGAAAVSVTGVTGVATLIDAFTYVPMPSVSAINPNTGSTAGGTEVAITGGGFTGATAVSFGGTPATSFTVLSDTEIMATAPAGASGTVDVVVTTPGGTSAAGAASSFTYVTPLAIDAIAPASGPTAGGTEVAITGTGFTGASAVSFGGITATSYTIDSDTQITAMAPAGAPGAAAVSVTGVTGVATLIDAFTYVPMPSVSAIAPNTGSTAGGTEVAITGGGFTGATAVSFGGTPATSFTVLSDTEIMATAPAGAAGTVDVVVTTPGGTSAVGAASSFTYVTPLAIDAIAPASGPTAGGTEVAITGTGFTGVGVVSFGGTNAQSFTVVNDTLITATTPAANTAGAVDVEVDTATLVNGFTYMAPPAISAIAPASGSTLGGTEVAITGGGFTGATAVSFGGTPAPSFTVLSDTEIMAIAPAGAAGTVDVVVTSPGGTSAVGAAGSFTYVTPLAIDAIAPASGPTAGGTEVAITGTGFTGVGVVSFGGTNAQSFTVVNDTLITATTPAANTAGAVDVEVDTATLVNGFTYMAPPAISAIAPASGSTLGGTEVAITGGGFTGATAVSFGGTPAPSFTVLSDTQITAIAPAGASGTIDIVVTSPGGTSAVGAAGSFTYVTPLAIDAIAPASGPTAGGSEVAITGTGFTGASVVSFGGTNAQSFTVVNDTLITATTPAANTAGAVDVEVDTATLVNGFTYMAPPAIDAIAPNTGSTLGGTLVTITGTDFMAPVSIRFGSVEAANVTLVNATTITATTPEGAIGAVDVTVTSAGQVATLAGGFSYTAPPLALAPEVAELPGIYGEPLSYRFEASGGTAPYSYEYAGGASPGLAFSVDTLSGTPLFQGDVPARITVTDANGDTASRDYRLIVAAPAVPVAADATGSMAFGNTSLAIDLTDNISGHSTSIAVATAPLHGTASVSGYVITYTPEAGFHGTDSFTYTASGPGGTSMPATVTVAVAAAVLEISPSSLPDPVAGSSYEQMLTASGGVAPYVFSLASGTTLPPGLELSPGGLISGTPTAAGPANFVVQATDAAGNSTTRDYAVTVSAPTLTLAPATLPGGTGGVAYQQTIAATGGVEPYSYSIDGGSLPTGLSLSRAGLLSGVPSMAGIDTFTVRVTDQLGFTATINYDLEIVAPVIAITPASLPDAVGGAAYDQTLTASGGAGPYAFQVNGNLPGGIELSSSGVFSGVPTQAGAFNFTVIAMDQNGFSGSQAYSVLVAPNLPVALSRSVTMMAGTTATVNLTEGATGGPFTGAAIVAAPPAGTGTASLSETELAFASHASASGAVVVGYTLSNRWGSSAPATITFVVQARPDPSKDPEVIGLIGAQIASADRLASGQIDNFRRRLEQLHDEDSRQAASFDIRFGQTDSARTNYAEDETRRDIFSPLGSANDGGNAARNASNPPGNKKSGRLAVWTGGYVNFGSRDGNGIDLDHTMVGVSAGMDYRFTPSFVGGVGLGFGRDATDIGGNGTESRAQALSAAIYGSYSPRPKVFLDGLLGYSRLDFDSSRYVTDTGDFAAGSRNGDQIFGSLVLGYEHRSGKFLLSPYGGLEGAWSQLGRFSETGAGLHNLTYDQMAASTLAGIAGLRFEYSVPTEWGMLKPRGRIEYSHDFAGSARTRLGYADLPGLLPYSVDVEARSTDSIRLEFGLDANILSNGWLVGVDYGTALGLNDSSSLSHTIGVKLGAKF
ncbi:IPT/TIG domain-containing protein [Mesorhizobium sp. CAU 1732]|uniref:IPT/TIG domain-containing protein n=1 Tax=Mesorhizobium sp. CAU 1732 TaxID=3140358 RepID=UPI003260E5E6